jgi:hypothetical protein
MVKKNTHNSNRILFLISLTLTSAVFAILFFQNINNDENKIAEISNINDIPMINVRRDSLISLLNNYKSHYYLKFLNFMDVNLMSLFFVKLPK